MRKGWKKLDQTTVKFFQGYYNKGAFQDQAYMNKTSRKLDKYVGEYDYEKSKKSFKNKF